MNELVQKVVENVMNGFYKDHEHGEELLRLDLQETIDNATSTVHDDHEKLANTCKADIRRLEDENDGLVADNKKLAEEKSEIWSELQKYKTDVENSDG